MSDLTSETNVNSTNDGETFTLEIALARDPTLGRKLMASLTPQDIKGLQAAIQRAINDPEFAELLRNEPKEALLQISVSANAIDSLLKIADELTPLTEPTPLPPII